MNHSRIAAAALLLFVSSGSAGAATFTVTNVLPAGAGSLAQAIANANATEAEDTIDFGVPFAGTKTIPGPFPAIEFPVILDGYTQGDASENTLQGKNTDAVLRVVLDGRRSGEGVGERQGLQRHAPAYGRSLR